MQNNKKRVGSYLNKWSVAILSVFLCGIFYSLILLRRLSDLRGDYLPTLYPTVDLGTPLDFLYLASQVLIAVNVILLLTRRKNFLRFWRWLGWWLALNLVIGIKYFASPHGGFLDLSGGLSMMFIMYTWVGLALLFVLIMEVPFWARAVYDFLRGRGR